MVTFDRVVFGQGLAARLPPLPTEEPLPWFNFAMTTGHSRKMIAEITGNFRPLLSSFATEENISCQW